MRSKRASAPIVSLLRDYDPLAPRESEVPDPYYGGDCGFDEVLDLCETAGAGLLERIHSDHEIS